MTEKEVQNMHNVYSRCLILTITIISFPFFDFSQNFGLCFPSTRKTLGSVCGPHRKLL